MGTEFVVRRTELQEQGERTMFVCELEGFWQKVSFCLIIKGCVGEKEYQAQYQAIEPYFRTGSLLECGTVYMRHHNAFGMALYSFRHIIPVTSYSGREIDVATYLNPNRGFWVMTRPVGPYVLIPGIIDLGGEAFIPVVDEKPLSHVARSYKYEAGLQYGRRPSAARILFRKLFGGD